MRFRMNASGWLAPSKPFVEIGGRRVYSDMVDVGKLRSIRVTAWKFTDSSDNNPYAGTMSNGVNISHNHLTDVSLQRGDLPCLMLMGPRGASFWFFEDVASMEVYLNHLRSYIPTLE